MLKFHGTRQVIRPGCDLPTPRSRAEPTRGPVARGHERQPELRRRHLRAGSRSQSTSTVSRRLAPPSALASASTSQTRIEQDWRVKQQPIRWQCRGYNLINTLPIRCAISTPNDPAWRRPRAANLRSHEAQTNTIPRNRRLSTIVISGSETEIEDLSERSSRSRRWAVSCRWRAEVPWHAAGHQAGL